MKRRLGLTFAIVTAFSSGIAPRAGADTFGSGANAFEIDFVDVGQPGNSADTTGEPNPVGAVSYGYRIGKYEIASQMVDKVNALAGLNLGAVGSQWGPDKPAVNLNWFEAARFVNWLNESSDRTPAYNFVNNAFQLWDPSDLGYDAENPFRNRKAKYFLPTTDEWHKAAYYDRVNRVYYDYSTGSDAIPTAVASGTAAGTAVYGDLSQTPADATQAGGLSPYGTTGQSGNVWEWEETELDLVNDSPTAPRGNRGGNWRLTDPFRLSASGRLGDVPDENADGFGFRVASTPEPGSLVLWSLGLAALMRRRKYKRGHATSPWNAPLKRVGPTGFEPATF